MTTLETNLSEQDDDEEDQYIQSTNKKFNFSILHQSVSLTGANDDDDYNQTTNQQEISMIKKIVKENRKLLNTPLS